MRGGGNKGVGSGAIKKMIPKHKIGSVAHYSINKCMLELGAPASEVYYSKTPYPKYRTWPKKPARIACCAAYRSIYNRYTGDELWQWAQSLYRNKVRAIHPDKHSGTDWEEIYEEYFKYIQEVFAKVKRILRK